MEQFVNIRKATKQDVEKIEKLAQKLLKNQIEINSFFKNVNVTRPINVSKEISKSNVCFFVAEHRKNLIGYAEVRLANKDYLFEAHDYALLVDLFLDKDAYKNLAFYKIAYLLYKSCENWAKLNNRKSLCGHVYGENIRVRRLLKHQNFKEYKINFIKKLC